MAISIRLPRRALVAVVPLFGLVAACAPAAAVPNYTYAPSASGGGAVAAAPSTAPSVLSSQAPTASPAPSAAVVPATVMTFTPGTVAAPRVVDLTADDQLNFTPGVVQAAVGETLTFRIHNMGKAVHEFMVGKLADAFGDKKGTAEVADIAGGKVGELTTTLTGDGPFGFACHAAGHFEHGMAGYIQLVGPGAPTVGTKDNPRVVRMDMTDQLKFMPMDVAVAKGETIRFVMTNSGTAVHEFQVGPADKVAADEADGKITIEKDKLDAGSTNIVDYTFSGDGPYAFACHEPGHFEAGMKGTITLVG